MFAHFKRESLRKLRMAEDKSPKGSIDEPIVDLIRLINDHPNYVRCVALLGCRLVAVGGVDGLIVDTYSCVLDCLQVTSSSCSGRIAVFCGVPAINASNGSDAAADVSAASEEREESVNLITKGGKWLLAEHATITMEQLSNALRSPDAVSTNSNMILSATLQAKRCVAVPALSLPGIQLIFKHEPFIMHVVCRDLDAAKELLQWGIACGFRESGVVLGNKKIMCAIRTTANGLEIPIAHTAKELLVSDHYLKWIVQIANEKFVANKRKTDQLLEAFKAKFGPQSALHAPVVPAANGIPTVTSVAFEQYKELKCDAVKRVGHTSVKYGDNKIVVFGGQGVTAAGTTSRLASLKILAVTEDDSLQAVYEDGEATPAANAPSARMQHTAVVVKNEMIVFGGRAGPTKPFNDVFAFNLDTKAWSRVETVGKAPSPRYKHSGSVVGSTMYIYGGRDAINVFGDLFALDLSQSPPQWRQIENSFSFPRFDHVSAVVEKTKLLFWGGMPSSRGAENDDEDASAVTTSAIDAQIASEKDQVFCFLYDTVANKWERRPIGNAKEGPEASLIAGNACEVSDYHVVISGGMTSSSLVNGDNATQKLFVLDAKTMQWMRLGQVKHANAAFAYHTCTWVAQNSSLYILGGGFQCFGFGQFYSSAYQCEVTLTKTSVPAASATAASSAAPSTPTDVTTTTTAPSSPSQPLPSSDKPLGVLAAKLDVKKIKTLLEKSGVYDKARRVHVVQLDDQKGGGSAFLIPVTSSFQDAAANNAELIALKLVVDEDAYANKFGKSSGLNRNEVIQSTILAFATKHNVPYVIQKAVPDKYEFVGDILLVPRESFLEDEWTKTGFAQEMWAKVCASTSPPFSRVARKAFIDASEKRQSHVDLLYVNHQALTSPRAQQAPGWVEVRENGIVYGWDITRVMFSSGNVTEKARMANIGCRDEVIVDLFCGIGYYVLPFLVHGGASFVHACEWNPDSVDALRFNLERNGVAHKCQVYLGDNRETAPKLADVADRVNLGLLPTSIKAWPLAVQVLKPQGGWFHVHDNVAVEDREAWEQHLLTSLRELAESFGKKWVISCEHVERVKSYAPKVHHLVADIHCVPRED